MHKIKKQRTQMRVHPVVTGSATHDSRVAVEALAEALRRNGMDDLASSVVLGPIGLAAESVGDEDALDAESDDGIDEEMEDILDEASDGDSDNEDEEDDLDGGDEEDDTFDEALDANDISDEDEEVDADDESEDVNPIQEIILDPDRVYSKTERSTLRNIANLCIARKHHVPNARALIRSLDAYESKQRSRA